MLDETKDLFFIGADCSARFAGQMGAVATEPHQPTYVFIGGGYYSSMYQKVDADYSNGGLDSMTAYDLSNSYGYGQLGVGTQSRIDRFVFDHQLSVSKLGDAEAFISARSTNKLRQRIDFGYDFMPKMTLVDQLSAYGILGAHYARFSYQKKPLESGGVVFDNQKEQLGFDLGAGFYYEINSNFTLGVKYQHLQYSTVKIRGTNAAETIVDVESFTPAFNLIGVDLRYYWN
jgi:opacity protein-like surface antigen